LDAGKTNAKLTLWDPAGRPLAHRVRANGNHQTAEYRALDANGIENWVIETLSEFARLGDIGAIIPVGHGAAAALILDDRLFAAPMDYEQEFDTAERERYAAQRDSFRETGSPLLPQGLNLGMQLHYLERLTRPWPDGLSIIPWPQYWAWRLCGVRASEVSSLGCHTDLWKPLKGEYSELAKRRGWSERMAPLRAAGEELGYLSPEWTARTGAPKNCVVLCGLHDSNAALLAARGHSQLRDSDATVLSTGTWFVAMRSPNAKISIDVSKLDEARDCLVNVDVQGRPIPSARFMGGREFDLISQVSAQQLANCEPQKLVGRLAALLDTGAAAMPTFAAGFGPYPRARGEWRNKPDDAGDQRAIAGLYLALMADACLDLVDSRDTLLIEGRFAEAVIFVGALAALRPRQKLFISNAVDVPYGALRLIHPELAPSSPLLPVAPLDVDFRGYARAWREHAAPGGG
jgi:sugar (pentulose or hexulose) kinase